MGEGEGVSRTWLLVEGRRMERYQEERRSPTVAAGKSERRTEWGGKRESEAEKDDGDRGGERESREKEGLTAGAVIRLRRPYRQHAIASTS